MTIPTSTGNAAVTYEGNGTTTLFDIPFAFATAAEIAVYLDGVAAGGVTVFGAGDPFGGTAVFAGAPANGDVVHIRRLQTVHVSGNDSTARPLAQKLVAGSGVTLIEQDDGGDETLQIAAVLPPASGEVKVSSNDTVAGFLNGKLVAGDGILLTEQNDGSNESLQIAVTGGLIPSGLVSPFAGATAPAGWLLCDGAAVGRETYAALFASIGIAYGAGDGTTTFNLPDLRGRVVAGRDDMGGTAAGRLTAASAAGLDGSVLGAAGGNQQHQLTVAEMPSHNHATGGDQVNTTSGTTSVLYTGSRSGYGTSSAGGNQPHTNVQPTLVVNYIIKA